MTDRVAVKAHAKANLFLRVLAREESGYHSLETLFTLLELADDLEVERIPEGIQLTVEGADTGPVEQNLAYRGAQKVLQATGARFGVRMHLTKHVPVSAGLGGGSSDGAAALHAVNALADHAVPNHEILQFAARLGADVAFFASHTPMALGWGRGERLYRVPPPESAPLLLVIPPFGISTARAYDLLDAGRSEDTSRGSIILEADAFRTWGGIARLGGNDFEVPVFGKEPSIRALFEKLCGTHPLLARLSGSGAALIAVYRTDPDREAAVLELAEKGHRIIRTATRAVPAEGPRLD